MTSRFADRASIITFALLTVTLTLSAQADQGRLTGRVTDGSGGALPGVSVTVAAPGSSRPVTVTTDGVGQYQTPPLPADTYTVTFELSGFQTRAIRTVVVRPGEVFVLDRQLALASLTETVTVTGAAPPPPSPPPPPAPPPPLRPRIDPVPVPKAALVSVCGPASPGDLDITVGHIVGHRHDQRRELYSQGDVLVLDVGADLGIAVGQNFVVRRRFRTGDKGAPLKFATFGEHTAGVVQIVETTTDAATVVVVYACGELMAGDSLEPFDALPVVAEHGTEPHFDDPARIVFGELGQMMGAPRQLMVIDRGFNQDVRRGQRLTIFRRALGDSGPTTRIADAVVVVTRPQSSTIRIERVTGEVEVGDLAALHR